LLGINCGFGQTDCATVPRAALDLKRKMLRWHRFKTGVDRACPLWPETVAALKKYQRPHTAEPSLMFVTEKLGNRWAWEAPVVNEAGRVVGVIHRDPLGQAFREIEKLAGVKVRGFYTLRHTFRTIAEGTGDTNAIRAIMGQAFSAMDDFYLHLDQRPDYQRRLRKVTEAVRAWVFGK
jgi:integrase